MKVVESSKQEILNVMAVEFVCVLLAVFCIFSWDQVVDTGRVILLNSLKPALCWAAGATALYFGVNEFVNRVDV